MGIIQHLPVRIWRFLRLPPRTAYALGLSRLIGRFVLLLTTTGRRTGLERVTPLQYELINGSYYVAAARGVRTDWLKNIEARPQVEIRVGTLRMQCHAEIILDEDRTLEFLNIRLERHPHMIRAIMRAAGLPRSPNLEQMRAYAAERPVVRLEPLADPDRSSEA
jgi:deazaflavin-dependent oxidoreductase (nitroreductase family)